MYSLKTFKLSLFIALFLLGCNNAEENKSDKNRTKVKTSSIKKESTYVHFFAKDGNASTIIIPIDQNNKQLQEEIKAFYEKYFSDKLEKALASSQNLHNPTFDPLIEAFPFAIRSTSFYKNAKRELSKKGYSIKNEISFEKFHTFSENGSYFFNFSPASLEASIGVTENPDLVPYACREIIDVKLAPYFTKRKHFINKKDNSCTQDDDASLVINSKTKKSIDLDGFGTAIKKFSFDNKEILQINSHMGAHTNGVSFFFIENNGELRLMKNGFMASDVGDPKVVVSDGIEVKTQYTRDKELCRYLIEDTFKYDTKKREFIKTKNAVEIMSECGDE